VEGWKQEKEDRLCEKLLAIESTQRIRKRWSTFLAVSKPVLYLKLLGEPGQNALLSNMPDDALPTALAKHGWPV
jgi:hypothetical protein